MIRHVVPLHSVASHLSVPDSPVSAVSAPPLAAARLATQAARTLKTKTPAKRRNARAPVRIEARLDLHGHSVHQAWQEFLAFMEQARRQEWRLVEIITGLGENGGGRIRREFPHWLAHPAIRERIIEASHPHPRNPGAVRLRLRAPGRRNAGRIFS